MVDVAVVGAAGYAGIECVRWVLGHPRLRLALATSAADAGRPIGSLYPALAQATSIEFSEPSIDRVADAATVALLAVPHTAAMALVPDLLAAGVSVIDLSADFRLVDPSAYEHWYGVAHTAPSLLGEAVYGLPELDRARLEGARLVACPGCYPTASLLAAVPAFESGLAVGARAIVDAKSGVSGAGRTPTAGTLFVTANESTTPYKVGSHRHTPEMAQALSGAAGRDVSVMFTPHLVPMSRGLLATVYLDVEEGLTSDEVVAVYRDRYHAEPFVHVCDAGTMPSTRDVLGTNRASIGIHVDESTSTLVAVCAIDNLGKGSAGQGIQCLNAVCKFPESEGLDVPSPVV